MSVAQPPWRPGILAARALLLLAATLAVSLAGAPGSAPPSPRGLDPKKALPQLGLDTWTTDHGLPNATVTAIRATRDGYVWLGTYDGLARFDGARFTVLTQADGLGNNGIRALCEDPGGHLWVGTNGGGVARISRGAIRRFTTAEGLPSDIVWALHTDVRDGSVWIGTNGGGLAHLAGGKIERLDPKLSGRTIAGIAQAADGTLWLATQADGLRRLAPDGSFTAYTEADGLPRGLVAGVAVGRDGAVWGASSDGLFLLRDGALAPLPGGLEPIGATLLSSVVEDGQGTLWVGTNGSGVARFADGKLSFLGAGDGVGDAVYALHADADGRLWIGTNGSGVSRLRDGSFTAYTSREGLSRDFTYTAFEDSEGRLWAGSAGGLDRFDGTVFVPGGAPLGRPVAVRSIAEGPDGALWLGTYGAGLLRLHGGRWQAFTSRDGLAHDTVRAVLVDRSGQVWAATNGGLSVFDGRSFRSYGLADGLPSTSLIGLAEDRTGALWLGTDGAGLVRRSEGRFTTFTSRDGLASNVVLALHRDSAGTLWVATNGGLSRLSGGRFTSFSSARGLPSDAVTQVVEDGGGDLWLGTSRGVLRLSRASLDAAGADPSRRLEVESFDLLDGMKSSQCTAPGQPSAFRSRDGRLWFATTRGLASVDPARSRQPHRPPSALVEEVAVDGKAAPFADGVDASPGTSRIELRFTKLSPLAPQRVAVRFQLEGFDRGWVEAGERRQADYTGVPPGSYTFRIAARTGGGEWNEASSGIPVRVLPRFTQTRGFALTAALVAAFVLAAGHRLRMRSLVAREKQLSRLVDERTRRLSTLAEDNARLFEQERVARETAERLQAATRALSSTIDRGAVVDLILVELEKVVPCDAVSIQELSDGMLVVIAARGSAAAAIGRRLEPAAGDGRGLEVLQGRRPVIREYASYAAEPDGSAPDEERSWMGVPLVFGDRVTGMLSLNKRERGYYTEAHAGRAAAFAAQAAVAIENARLFGAVREELAERTRAQQELAQSELRFRQLTENIDALFFVRSVDPPRFLYVSPGFERIWGRPAPASGREFMETVHPDDREALAATLLRQAEGYDVEYRILRPDGSLRWIHSRAFPVQDHAGQVFRVAGIAEDVTERKSVEQLREDLTRTLVHDLRNPLTSMLSSLDALEASLGPEAAAPAALVRIARRGGIKLRSLVDAILDVSRLEEGAMPVALTPVDLGAAVAEAFELQRPLAEPRRLTLVSAIPPGFPRAWADRELLSRILQNLVGNAIKFAPRGGEVRVQAERDEEPGMLRVSVADDGPGLPAELRERVFEKFVTGRHAASGSGLGLTFCRLAVEAQGGRILAESRPGGGALLVFTLPEARDGLA